LRIGVAVLDRGAAMSRVDANRVAPASSWRRPALILASVLFAWTLHTSHQGYLNDVWDYLGFVYVPWNENSAAFSLLMVALGALFVPVRLERPSSVVLFLLYVMVYVPAMVITPSLGEDALDRYLFALLSMSAGFAIACILPRLLRAPRHVQGALPGEFAISIMLAAWVLCCIYLLLRFGSIMRFVGEDELYAQRAIGASTDLFTGYVQVSFSNLLSPALMAVGLLRRRWSLVVLGVAGCLIMFMINAQRTVFMLPIVLLGMHLLMSGRFARFRATGLLIALLALVTLFANAYYEQNEAAEFAARHVVFRSVAVPGLTFSQYHDLFELNGYTWWTHVRGVSLIVPTPPQHAHNPLWPGLGYMLGDHLYNAPAFNINANLFSGDGVAAAGPVGVVVIGVALGIWLLVLDGAARGWDRRFVLMVVFPVALTLTNGHLTTTLLSYGGIFWTLLFLLYKPRAEQVARPGAAVPDAAGRVA
jgi:hypothetical protein